MDKEQRKIIDILLWISQQSNKLQDAHEEVQLITEKASIYTRLVDRQLEGILIDEPRVDLLEHGFIYLRPIKKGGWLVPALSVSYDFTRKNPNVSYKVLLFVWSETKGLRALVYRYETPNVGMGMHNFYHAQLMKIFDRGRWPPLPCEEWIPTEYPAFPLDAGKDPNDPVSLLICLLVSLYDLELIRDLLGTRFKNTIKGNIQQLKLFSLVT